MIIFDHVSKVYPNGTVGLDDVNLTIQDGEFVAIIGRSGAGKSTLLRSVNRMHQITAGTLTVNGTDVSTLSGKSLRRFRRGIGMVFQSFNLVTRTTVIKNVLSACVPDMPFWRVLLGTFRKEDKIKALESLDKVGILDKAYMRADQLSGGQQQRVALARSLAKSPKVLLLDESLSALDFKLRRQMQVELKRLQRETGIIFIFVTHDQEEALSMADHIAVFSKGKPEQVGTPEEIYDKPANRFVADFIGDINFLDATVHDAGSVEVEGKIFPVTQDLSEYGRGAAVSAAVRPERITLGAAKDGGLQASVETVTYMGSDIRCHVRLADGTPVQIRVNPPFDSELLTVGAKVGVTVSPDHMRVVER